MSRFSFFIGIVFCVFGVVFIGMSILTPIGFIAVPFSIIWTCIAVFNTYQAYKNGFTEEGAPLYEINTTETDRTIDFDEKLRKLNGLRQDGLITEAEYLTKRNEIITSQW